MDYIDVKNNETPEICTKCGGYCCKAYAGIYHPKDFGDIEKELFELKEKGLISIDQWDGPLIVPDNTEDDFYDVRFVRPRHTNSNELVDLSYGGRCIYLRENGCELPFEKRPYQCKLLKPMREFIYGCMSPYSKMEAAIAWIPYQNLIQNLINSDN